jgi:hypothetical protein
MDKTRQTVIFFMTRHYHKTTNKLHTQVFGHNFLGQMCMGRYKMTKNLYEYTYTDLNDKILCHVPLKILFLILLQ